jgi:stage II sporulation protein P
MPPKNDKSGGKVVTRKMSGNRAKYGIATVNRSGKREDIPAALKADLPFTFEDTDEPQVLILHTHTTEGYMTYDGGYYNSEDRNRTQDHSRNVCAVGEAVRLALAAEGITAIHDTAVHDSPVYSGAYSRSAKTAEGYLAKYPTIQVVLDLHRDAVMRGDTDIVKPTAVVDGQKAAQMMLITGVVSTEELPHPHWQENLTFSTHLQQALGRLSPHLMRPLNTVASRYNQHLSPGWVLVEVGSEGNTVEEAVYAGQLLGETLADLLK